MTTKQELDTRLTFVEKGLNHEKFVADKAHDLMDKRLTKLESKVSSLDYSTSRSLLDLDKKVGSNEKTLIANTNIAMAWVIFMIPFLIGFFIWNMAMSFSINDINARTVAHQTLPEISK